MDARPLARFFTRGAFGAPRKAVSGIRVQNISTKRDSAETGFLSPCRCAIVPRDPVSTREHPMALEPLAKRGNFFHIYDFRVKPGKGDEFIKLFDAFDYSDENPMHKSPAQVKDGVLCRDVRDPDHFYLVGEWSDIEVHAKIRKILAEELKPAFVGLIEGGKFVPNYAEIVSSTPQHILDGASKR